MEKDPQQRLLIVTQGDITLIPLKEGALVNPSNTGLILNSGVGLQIARRGGPLMQQTLHMARSRLKNNRLDPGKSVVTEPGQLRAKNLIHVAIVGAKKVNNRLISSAIANAYHTADELGVRQLAFPAVGVGVGGFTMDKFLEAFWKVTSDVFPRMKNVREVYLCMDEGDDFAQATAYAEANSELLAKSLKYEINPLGLGPNMFM